MNPIHGHHLIKPDDLHRRLSNLMKIPNADYLERAASENLGARLWRLPPRGANTLHKHIRAEEFYFVLEGPGQIWLETTAGIPSGLPGDTHFTFANCFWKNSSISAFTFRPLASGW